MNGNTRDTHGIILGAEVLAMGVLAVASVFRPLEFAVTAGGPLIAGVGLLYLFMRSMWPTNGTAYLLGAVVVALGVLLATHDYIFAPGVAVPIHFVTAVGLVVVGGLQMAHAGLAVDDASGRTTAA